MNPAVQSNLMAGASKSALLLRVKERDHGRNIKRGSDARLVEQSFNARNPDPISVLPPAQASHGMSTIGPLLGFMIAIEGQRACARCISWPFVWPQRPA